MTWVDTRGLGLRWTEHDEQLYQDDELVLAEARLATAHAMGTWGMIRRLERFIAQRVRAILRLPRVVRQRVKPCMRSSPEARLARRVVSMITDLSRRAEDTRGVVTGDPTLPGKEMSGWQGKKMDGPEPSGPTDMETSGESSWLDQMVNDDLRDLSTRKPKRSTTSAGPRRRSKPKTGPRCK